MPGRRAIRRTALFLLFQWDVTGRPLGELYEGQAPPEALQLAEHVAADADGLDVRITAAAEGWTADRLGAVERNVLRVALTEIDGEDVPDEVAVNEAVELAKRYASEDAARLVNGILGRIVREKEEFGERGGVAAAGGGAARPAGGGAGEARERAGRG